MRRKPGALLPYERTLLSKLAAGPAHAYALDAIGSKTGATFKALRRLEAMGEVASEFENVTCHRPRRIYRIEEPPA